MKILFKKITDILADAALLEMGVPVTTVVETAGAIHESLEEIFMEVAFAEADDYDDIHEDILREHRTDRDVSHPDDCRHGDNGLCFV